MSSFASGNAKVSSFASGNAKVPNASSFASQWNIGFRGIPRNYKNRGGGGVEGACDFSVNFLCFTPPKSATDKYLCRVVSVIYLLSWT